MSVSDTPAATENDTPSEQHENINLDAAEMATRSQDRPSGLPDKFWDADQSSVRTEALVKSYLGLEKHFSETGSTGIPKSPEDYSVMPTNELIHSDPELNSRLHEAGFSQNQAELVYELASEYLHPLVSQMSGELEAQNQIEKLSEEFGGEDRWREISAQLSSFGKSHYTPEVYQALASSVDGVRTMYKSMGSREPGILDNQGTASGGHSERSLKALMRDPRYWRDQNPSIVAEVRDGFSKLYPGSG